MDDLNIDWESFSEVNLREVGTSAYTRHPSTEVLMGAYALNDSAVEQWIPAEGQPMPKLLREMLLSPDVRKRAWNAQFEITVCRNVLKLPVDVRQWRCTMVWAMACSLPGKLEKVGPILKLDGDKLKDSKGAALMKKFSFPRRPTRANKATRTHWSDDLVAWEDYLSYNRSDVVAERAIMKRLRPFPMSQAEWELWWLDQEINEAGLPVNLAMVNNAISIYEKAMDRGMAEMRDLTGLQNPNSNVQILPWLRDNGYMFADLKKGHIKTASDYFEKRPDHWDEEYWIEYRANEELRRVLQLRASTSKASIKKYYALKRATDSDGLLRYTLQMNGAARTGRWAGRIYQPQNLVKPEKYLEDLQAEVAMSVEVLDLDSMELIYGDVFDSLATAIRPSAQAPEGYRFVSRDLSAIENRVLGWLSGCEKILQVFKNNLDPYISFATYLYDQPYEKLWHEYKVLKQGGKRTIAKPGTLGCGYGMGHGEARENATTGEIEGTGLLGYAWNMGVKSFTVEDSKHSVETFRREFIEVKEYWYDIERAMRRCIKTGKPTKHGVIRFDRQGPFLNMWLPSGRPLRYLRPKLEERKTPWGEKRLTITYEGMDDKKRWVRLHTTPGKITENADQAISRDLLVHGMKLAKKRGIDIRLHVHDEIVGLVSERASDQHLEILKECMNESPSWAPDLPMGSAGHVTKVMVKD